MDKFIWYLKQLLPLKYHTTFTDVTANQRIIAVWRMWFGRQFWVQEWVLAEKPAARNQAEEGGE